MPRQKTARSDRSRVQLSRERFSRSLVEQHLEELSWLYDQRIYLLEDGQRSWLDVAGNEQRFSNHLRSLSLLGDKATRHCLELASNEDPGSVHAAVGLLCIRENFGLLDRLFRALDWNDEDLARAAFGALKHTCPESLKTSLQAWTVPGCRVPASELAVVCGYRRWGLNGLRGLKERSITPGFAWAVGRCAATGYYDILRRISADQDAILGLEVAIALLRCGQSDQLSGLIDKLSKEDWPRLVVGLCCDPRLYEKLIDSVSADPGLEGLRALGLVGEPRAVDCLIEGLTRLELAGTAAEALHLMTGADLKEEVPVPQELDEEVEEENKDDQEIVPTQATSHDEPVEQSIEMWERISRDPRVWQGWWKANQRHFHSGLRYRYGVSCSPAELVRTLEDPDSPVWARRYTYEELVIRYRADLAFETDYLVTEQHTAISNYRRWHRAHHQTFAPGKWYLYGKPV